MILDRLYFVQARHAAATSAASFPKPLFFILSAQPCNKSGVAAFHFASSEAGNSLNTPPAFLILAMDFSVPVTNQSR